MTEEELRRLIDQPSSRAQVSAVALAQAFLERVGENDEYNAVMTLTPELALADARNADAARSRRAPLPLDGLPILVKDNIDVAGIRCTVGSRLFYDRIAERDATVVRRLREAGAVILGKAFLHEFAFGVTSNAILGACRNPWDPARIPGGSSGGSGAGLAADFAIGALGTDTGGSVRLPAAINGVTGLRPTSGAVSNHGVYPLSPTLDTVGPMARAASDVAQLFEVMRGYDPLDPWSSQAPPVTQLALHPMRGLRIGIVEEFFFEGADPQIEHVVRDAAERLRELGARIFTLAIPGAEAAFSSAGRLASAEAAAVYERFLDDPRTVMSDEIRERFELGRKVDGVAFARALANMMDWRRSIAQIFEETADLLLTPTVAVPTFTIEGTKMLPAARALTKLTYPWSFAGIPAISIPCGFSLDGMPVGMQLAAAQWREDVLLATAEAYQKVTDWHLRRPRVSAEAATASGVK